MKYTVIDLEALNKPLVFTKGSLENYCSGSFFEDFPAQIAPEENRSSKENMACSEDKCCDDNSETERKEPSNRFDSWSLYIDGSKCKEGVGTGCILTDPEGNNNLIACRPEFECTNNTTEYEVLIHGLEKAIDLGLRKIQIFGDSEIVIRQVKNQVHCVSAHLLNYHDKVCEQLKLFDEFFINSVPRNQNFAADLLANVASKLIPATKMPTTTFSVQLLFRPSMLDNVTNFIVFDDDEQIINFLALKDAFKDVEIDD